MKLMSNYNSNSTQVIRLRRWSVLFVATLASGLQSSICLMTQAAQDSSDSMWPTGPLGSSDSNVGDDSVAIDGGRVLLSNEFYLFQPGKAHVVSDPSAVVYNSEDQIKGFHQQVPAAAAAQPPPPIINTNNDDNNNFRDQQNKTVCQPPEVNRLNGSVNDNNCTNNLKRIPATNESTAQTTISSKLSTGSKIENNTPKNSSISIGTSGDGNGGRSGHKKPIISGPYCLGTKDPESSLFNWLCQGTDLVGVPVELPKPMSLRLSNTGIETLTGNSFPNYRDTLRDFSMENAPKLVAIEEGTFAELIKLRVVYIFQAPKLVSFDFALSGLHPDLTIIHIQQTGLRHWPNLSRFKQERILNSLELDNNRISALSPMPIHIRTELLNLGFNLISSIDEFTFNGSEIGTLSLSGNRKLSFIHPNAFANLQNLIKLDLSSTSVAQLPPVGLHQLRTLIIRDTYTLKKIPSIYVFPMLEIAHLTYAYHCCSFKYPQTHDPSAYEDHLRLQDELNVLCGNRKDTGAIGQPDILQQQQQLNDTSGGSLDNDKQRQLNEQPPATSTQAPNSDFEGYFEMDSNQKMVGVAGDEMTMTQQQQQPIGPTITQPTNNKQTSKPSQSRQQPEMVTAAAAAAAGKSQSSSSAGGHHQSSLNQWLMHNIECGELAIKYTTFPNIACTPEPDAFNPCEDIMGYPVLRVAVWFVVGAAVFGNLSVIVVLMGVFRRLSVPKFLQLNLAIGDLFMGIYLAMLALADLTTVGSYFNFAIDWQHGYGCKVAGAASLFASQLSIFTLCVITFERYYTITYSIDLNMRLQLGWATKIMFLGWLFAFASAMLPIFADITSYTKTSICLPMRTSELMDRIFLAVLLIIDSSAFVIIFACYLRMYLLIIRQKTEATAKERKIAMRMALLVFTDFVCWAPIIFFGATALFGTPLISVTNSKILIVFFYPLNSMANPFLYVISTRQYRRDLNYLTSRLHIWRKNLFNRNNDSYYSQNAAYGVAQYQGNPLNAHMGAVAALAAVTGVAQHHQPIHLNGLNPKERRIVCTKSHKGRYIIRHQILTDAQLPGDSRGLSGRPGNQTCHMMDGGRVVAAQAKQRGHDTNHHHHHHHHHHHNNRHHHHHHRQQVTPASAAADQGKLPAEVDKCTGGSECCQGKQLLGQISCASKLVNLSADKMTDDSTESVSNELMMAAATACCDQVKSDPSRSKQSTTCSIGKKPGNGANELVCTDSRLVKRTCDCCCRCYRWSGASPNNPTDETSFEGPRSHQLAELSQKQSVTMVTSLPKNQSGTTEQPTSAALPNNMSGGNEEDDQQFINNNNNNSDMKRQQDDDNKSTKNIGRVRQILGPRCSCPLVEDIRGFQNLDDIFKGSLIDGEDQLRCEAHPMNHSGEIGESNCVSPEGCPIDILGNISYNEPTSSQSGISSPPICNQAGELYIHNSETFHRQEHPMTTATCCSATNGNRYRRRRRCRCCSRQYYVCEGYKQRQEKPIEGKDGNGGLSEGSGINNDNGPAASHDNNLFPVPDDLNASSDQSSDKNSSRRLHHLQNNRHYNNCHNHRHHRHCERDHHNHHHHHHQKRHHNHNHNPLNHLLSPQLSHQSDDAIRRPVHADGQDVARSASQKGYADKDDDKQQQQLTMVEDGGRRRPHGDGDGDGDELIDFSPAAVDPIDLVDGSCSGSLVTGGGGGGGGGGGESHRQLESILKSNKPGGPNSQVAAPSGSRGSGKWSSIVILFRGGSFQSNTMRGKEKKRVSIVDHHSG